MNKQIFATMILALLVMIVSSPAIGATYDSSVTLENKDSTTWEIIDDEYSAVIEYNASGNTFAWHASGRVTEPGCVYLIYYGDERNDRFVNYGGGYPGAVIAMISTDYCGVFDESGETELDMNLPSYPDGNMDVYDYSGDPDYYDPGCGAKLWIVPCEGYDIETCSFYPNWDPDNYLFETSLIWYDDTEVNEPPEIRTVAGTGSCHAGEESEIWVIVYDADGLDDLNNMDVAVNLSEYGFETTLLLDEVLDCVRARYIGNVTLTVAGEDICGEVVATDPSGNYSDWGICYDVTPGPCAQLVIEGPDKALTRKSFCQWFEDDNYIVRLDVSCEDEYGNPTYNCDCDLEATATGSASILSYQNGRCGWEIRVTNWDSPETVTINAHCVCDPYVESATHDITFLNQIDTLEVTSDPGVLYEMNDCSEDRECVNISAQLVDDSGEPIPMPGVWTQFVIDGCWYGEEVETDENGTATIELCIELEYDESIDVLAIAICREGTMTIDIVEPELYCVEIDDPKSPVTSGDNQTLRCTCYTNHDTEMCCDNATWSCDDLGEINDSTGYFTAGENEGVAEITVNVSGVFGTVDIAINAITNCSEDGEIIANEEFTLTSGTVSITGNYSGDNGYACVQAIGDPIGDWTNDTKGAWVYTNEDVILELNGTGDMYMLNRTSEIWEFYAAGDTAEVEGDEYYALISPIDPCDGITCENGCQGYHLWSYVCDDGECVPYKLIESNCVECGYTKSYSGSGGGSGSGTYPPNWDIPKNVTTGSSNNTTSPDDKVSIPTPTPTMPESPIRPNASTNNLLNETDDDYPESPGFTGIVLVGALLIAIGIVAIMARRKER